VGTLTDLNFVLVKRPRGWRMTLEYNSDIFERRTAERLFNLWAAAIEIAVTDPGTSLSEFGKAASDKAAPEASLHSGPASLENAAARPSAGDVPPAAPAPLPAAVSGPDREAVEQQLIGIWRTILRTPDVKPESNFFDLGGHSFSAMRMLAKASDVLGVKIDPAGFFRNPTIAALSRYNAGVKDKDEWRIVPIQPLGTRPTIIAINGATGYYNVYKSLSANLGADQPLISVQPYDPGIPGDLGGRSMEDIGADYLRLLTMVDPHGPYVVLGHCSFGLIAFEVARQLCAAGKTVLAVVMFDSWVPGYTASLPRAHRFLIRLLSRYQVHRNRFKRILGREITFRQSITTYQSIRAISRLLLRLGLTSAVRETVPDEDWYLTDAIRARGSYNPGKYDGDVLLIASDDCARGRLFDPELGWRKLVTGRIGVHWVGGYHMTMGYGGRAATIAAHIRSFLAAGN
jgi:thioesterase domain-containing protein/acyl carrier protein